MLLLQSSANPDLKDSEGRYGHLLACHTKAPLCIQFVQDSKGLCVCLTKDLASLCRYGHGVYMHIIEPQTKVLYAWYSSRLYQDLKARAASQGHHQKGTEHAANLCHHQVVFLGGGSRLKHIYCLTSRLSNQ